MTADFDLGDNYQLDEDSNGDFVLIDGDGTTVIIHDNSGDTLTIEDPTTFNGAITDPAGVSHSGELADASDAISDHGNLNGLSDDDHTQYLLADGTRAMSGDLDLGSNSIINIVNATLSGELAASTTDTDTLEFLDANEITPTQTGVSGTVNIDLTASNWHDPIEADGDITINFQNVASDGNSLLLYFTDADTTGPHTITWPASVEWRGGDVGDTIPQDGNIEVQLRSPDGGTTWRATYAQGFQ